MASTIRPPTPPPLHDLTPEELRAVFEQLDREDGIEIDYDIPPLIDLADDRENRDMAIDEADVHGVWSNMSGDEIERMLEDAYDSDAADAPEPPRDFESVKLNLRTGMRA